MRRASSFDAAILRRIQARTARSSVDAASLRNQGGPGVLAATRAHLAKIDLAAFSGVPKSAFAKRLDAETEALRRAMPSGARAWGAARKALNLFLRDVLYHRILCERYGLRRLEPWLEIPLDSISAEAIRREAAGLELPRWLGLKGLTPESSEAHQKAALAIARRRGTARIHLDILWLPSGAAQTRKL
jgi:hypothetical protein